MTEIWQQLPSWINKNSGRGKNRFMGHYPTNSKLFFPHNGCFFSLSACYSYPPLNLSQQQLSQTQLTPDLSNGAIYQADADL